MPKRCPTSDLNHDNWDREEQPDEKGTFSQASEDELKTRVIKKARRRIGTEKSSEAPAVGSIFSGLSGFGKNSSNISTSKVASTFSFLSKIPSVPSIVNSSTVAEVEKKNIETLPKMDSPNVEGATKILPTPEENNTSMEVTGEQPPKVMEYDTSIRNLNVALSNWIKKQIDENPSCILTPVLVDYERYLKEIKVTKLKKDQSHAVFDSSFNFIFPTATAKKTSTLNVSKI